MAILLKETKNNISFLTPEQRKQRKMLGLLGVVVLIIAAVFYFGYFKKNGAPPPVTPGAMTGQSATGQDSAAFLMEEAAKNLKEKSFIYQDKRFLELKARGDLPIVAGEKGRENPFIPF